MMKSPLSHHLFGVVVAVAGWVGGVASCGVASRGGVVVLGVVAVLASVACETESTMSLPPPIVVASEPAAPAPTAGLCDEHGLVKDLCSKCNPSLEAVFRAAGDWCEDHGYPRSRCPQCDPESASERTVRELEAKVVRFRNADLEHVAGIRAVAARRTSPETIVECSGRLAFDRDRVAEIRAAVPGVVRKVNVAVGAHVERGDVLFELNSTRVGEVQAEVRAATEAVTVAQGQLRRQTELERQQIASRRQVDVARQELAAAKARVDVAKATLNLAGAGQRRVSGRFGLPSPISGTVVDRPGIVGALATQDAALATVADTSVMWALCEVPEHQAARLAKGQSMRLSTGGSVAAGVTGTISWIDAQVDPRSRMVTVRAELPNPDGRLRAHQFVRGHITVAASDPVVTVPREAIQRVGDHDVVFVRTNNGVYETRRVQRQGGGDPIAVAGNLREGDAVVTTGAVLLRTEIMPGSIGAGCCEVTPPTAN